MLNRKSPIQKEEYKIIANKFVIQTKEEIKNFNRKPEFIINMDETPYYWDYLPRKIVTPKLCKQAQGWKRNYYNSRSTLLLSVTASEKVLRPTLILKREAPYYLKCEMILTC